MRLITFLLLCLITLGASSQVTLSQEEFDKLPKEIQLQIQSNEESSKTIEETSEATGIGTEIGIAVSSTLEAVKGSVLEVADSNLGKVTIGIALWKLLWKDIAGLIIGLVLFGFSMYFGVKAIKKYDDTDESEEDVAARRVISGIIAIVLFIASMACAFG